MCVSNNLKKKKTLLTKNQLWINWNLTKSQLESTRNELGINKDLINS